MPTQIKAHLKVDANQNGPVFSDRGSIFCSQLAPPQTGIVGKLPVARRPFELVNACITNIPFVASRQKRGYKSKEPSETEVTVWGG